MSLHRPVLPPTVSLLSFAGPCPSVAHPVALSSPSARLTNSACTHTHTDRHRQTRTRTRSLACISSSSSSFYQRYEDQDRHWVSINLKLIVSSFFSFLFSIVPLVCLKSTGGKMCTRSKTETRSSELTVVLRLFPSPSLRYPADICGEHRSAVVGCLRPRVGISSAKIYQA